MAFKAVCHDRKGPWCLSGHAKWSVLDCSPDLYIWIPSRNRDSFLTGADESILSCFWGCPRWGNPTMMFGCWSRSSIWIFCCSIPTNFEIPWFFVVVLEASFSSQSFDQLFWFPIDRNSSAWKRLFGILMSYWIMVFWTRNRGYI